MSEATRYLRLNWAGTDRVVVLGLSGTRYEFTRDTVTAVASTDADEVLRYTTEVAAPGYCCGESRPMTTIPLFVEE